MKKVVVVFGGVVLCGLAAVAQGPVVSNVQFTQPVPGLVAITYDLVQPEEKPCLVWVELSKDGGGTYPFVASTLSGDHGFDVVPGTGKRIEWRADREFPGEDITSAKLRVVADDDNLPFTGYVLRFADIAFVWIDAGTFEMGQVGMVEPVHQVTLTQGFWLSKYVPPNGSTVNSVPTVEEMGDGGIRASALSMFPLSSVTANWNNPLEAVTSSVTDVSRSPGLQVATSSLVMVHVLLSPMASETEPSAAQSPPHTPAV